MAVPKSKKSYSKKKKFIYKKNIIYKYNNFKYIYNYSRRIDFIYPILNNLLYFNYLDFINFLIIYLIIYNFSIFFILIIILNNNYNNLSINNFFYFLSKNSYKNFFIFIILLSLSGVPPVLGFFLKMRLISLVSFLSLYKIFILLFFFFFISLYFYIQNIRYLIIEKNILYKNYSLNDIKNNIFYINSSIFFIFLLIFGFLLLNDIKIIISFFFIF